jgi:hypothetical protein
MYYKLIRQPTEGKAVPGKLYRTSHYYNKRTGVYVEQLHYLCETLENADYLIPALIYRLQVTQSPRFQRLLPILLQVPGRSGIRIHRGTRPEHSRGCVLVSAEKEQLLTARWLKEQKRHEETRIEISTARAGA